MVYIFMALATWRIASLFVHEDGPFFIFRKIRTWAGIAHDEWGGKYQIPDTFFAQLLSCVWCSSLWVGGALALLYYYSITLAFYASLPFALSAAAIWFEKYFEGNRH